MTKLKLEIVLWESVSMNNVCTQVGLQQRKGNSDYLILRNDSGKEINFFIDDFMNMAEIVMDKVQRIRESEEDG